MTIVLTVVGLPVAGVANRVLGEDDGRIVIDEAAGMSLALTGAPISIVGAIVAFAWFRVLDIGKPPPIGRADRTGGGAGVMLDDLVAGAMAAVLTAATMLLWATLGAG